MFCKYIKKKSKLQAFFSTFLPYGTVILPIYKNPLGTFAPSGSCMQINQLYYAYLILSASRISLSSAFTPLLAITSITIEAKGKNQSHENLVEDVHCSQIYGSTPSVAYHRMSSSIFTLQSFICFFRSLYLKIVYMAKAEDTTSNTIRPMNRCPNPTNAQSSVHIAAAKRYTDCMR